MSATGRSHRILPIGLGNVFLNDLIELKQNGALDGATRVMEIGAQQIFVSLMIASQRRPDLMDFSALFCYMPAPSGAGAYASAAMQS